MPLIGEHGFVDVPKENRWEIDKFKSENEHELGLRMGALVPYQSIHFNVGEVDSFQYTVSASTRYVEPTNPDVIIDAFLSRDVNNEVSLHITKSPIVEDTRQNDLELESPVQQEEVVTIRTKQKYNSDLFEIFTKKGKYTDRLIMQTIEQYQSVYSSISSVLDRIETENKATYGTELPGRARENGRPSLEALAGYALVPFGKRRDGSYSRAKYIQRRELSEELLEILDARENPDSL